MEKISLQDLVARVGQATVARALGVKPASIAKAIRSRRNIIVTVAEDGFYKAEETRPFPAHSDSAECSDSTLGGAFEQPNGNHPA